MQTTVSDLRVMGARWYARYTDGNISMDGPTSFPASMSRAEVLQAIRSKSPDVQISGDGTVEA